MTSLLRLHPDDLQAIVDGIAAAVGPVAPRGQMHWLSTAEVARAFGRSQEWVRDHAAELGGRKIGGPRAPWRFPAECLDQVGRSIRAPAEPAPQAPLRRRRSTTVELLPIRG